MIIIGIIPARYGSTRFPGKPLVDIDGKSMIQRVYEQAKKSVHLSEVVVATDDTRIEQHVKGFNGKVVMTSDQHQSGTDRCFEAMETFAVKADVELGGFDQLFNLKAGRTMQEYFGLSEGKNPTKDDA